MTLTAITDNIYQVRLPLPFTLNHVNCYLLRSTEGWTILDTGLNYPASHEGWQQAWAELAIAPSQIKQIILTHVHPDHVGMAGQLQEWTGAPVMLSPRERELAHGMWENPADSPADLESYWHKMGIEQEIRHNVEQQMTYLRPHVLPLAQHFVLIEPGSTLALAGQHFEAIHAPGHSDGQLLFYDSTTRLLFCGDQVLQKITPNIGQWPLSEPNPLGRYLASLTQLAQLDVRLALPGHGRLIEDWAGRIGELQRHHARRLEQMLAVARYGATTRQVCQVLFGFDQLNQHDRRFALAETLAHLEYLVSTNDLQFVDGKFIM